MNRTQLRAFLGIARYLGVHLTDLRGQTLRDLLEGLDSPACPVYWGMWTNLELDARL